MANKRLSYIDIAKGMAILLLALGHTLGYSEHSKIVYKLIYSFVVPLFFLVSGFTASVRSGFIEFAKKRFLRIMVPYFVWAVLFLIPYALFGDDVGEAVGKATQTDYLVIARNILYGVGKNRWLQQNSTLWFLPALFVIEITYYFVIRFMTRINKVTAELCTIALLMIIGHFSNRYMQIVLPWGINTMLVAGAYYYVGNVIKRYGIVERIMKLRMRYLYLLTLGIIGILAGLENSSLNFMHYKIANMWLAYVSGVTLPLVVLGVSYTINRCSLLEYAGRNTMSIMIFHKLPILVFQTRLGCISDLLKSSNLFVEVFMAIAITIFAAGCTIVVAQILKVAAPFSIGEKKQ